MCIQPNFFVRFKKYVNIGFNFETHVNVLNYSECYIIIKFGNKSEKIEFNSIETKFSEIDKMIINACTKLYLLSNIENYLNLKQGYLFVNNLLK